MRGGKPTKTFAWCLMLSLATPALSQEAAIGRTVALSAEISVSPPGSNAIPSVWPFLLGGLNVLKLGLALDANREAQLANG